MAKYNGMYVDPAFQIGLMLGDAYGTMWANNAKNRQRAQFEDIIDNIKNKNYIDEIAAAQENAQTLSAQNQQKVIDNALQKQPAQNNIELSTPILDSLSKPSVKERAIQNIVNADAAANINRLERQSTMTPEQRAKENWNSGYNIADIVAAGNKAGINPEVINEYLPMLKDDTARQARNVMLPGIMDKMYGSVNDKGEYVAPTAQDFMKANQMAMQLSEYDPDMAKIILSGSVSPADLYAQKLADDKYDKQQQNAINNAILKEQLRRDGIQWAISNGYPVSGSGRVRTSGTRSSSNKSIIGSKEFEYANERLNELKEKLQYGEKLTPEEKQDFNTYSAYIDAAVKTVYNQGGNIPNTSSNGIDFNDYNQVVAAINQLQQEGYDNQTILKDLKEKMGDGEMYRNIARSLQPPARQTQQPEEDTSISFFEDWGSGERGGLINALDQGMTIKEYLESIYGN